MFHFSGKKPSNLGVTNSMLAPPLPKPNNVSSQADPTDRHHYIAPFKAEGDPSTAFQRLARIVEGQPRARLITANGHYLHAEFSSPLMGFVDDLEFLLLPEQALIHVRSGARLGYSDLGVNRRRVESLRAQFGSVGGGSLLESSRPDRAA